MKLNTAMFAACIGGQLEIQNREEGYLFRGEIRGVVVENDQLTVTFAWLAKNDGTPTRPSTEWTMDTRNDYNASLSIYDSSNTGEGLICLYSAITHEMIVFFPKGYTNHDGEESKLDRARVKTDRIRASEQHPEV